MNQTSEIPVKDDPNGWRQEGRDLLRAVTAGAIIGMPLLYTMEVWWHGMALSEMHLLIILGATLVVNFVLSLFSGFRDEYSWGEAISEALTALGIGIVFSTIILWLIGEVNFNSSLAEASGKILIEAAVVSVGVSFSNIYIRNKSRTGEENSGEESTEKSPDTKAPQDDAPPLDLQRLQLRADLKDVAATLAGALVFALNIAPTEEVIMIASRLTAWQQLAMLCASLLLCYMVLFASGLGENEVHVDGVFQHPVAETIMTSALSLVVALGLLTLFGQRAAVTDPATLCAALVTLGLPAIVGGAAGRIII